MKNKKLLMSVIVLTLASLTLVGCSSKVKTTDVAKTPITADPTNETADPTNETGSTNEPGSVSTTQAEGTLDAADVRDNKSTNPVIKAASLFADYLEKNVDPQKKDADWVDYLNNTFIPANKDITISNNGNSHVNVVYFSDANTKACAIVSLDQTLQSGHFVIVTGKNYKLCATYEAIFKKPATKIK